MTFCIKQGFSWYNSLRFITERGIFKRRCSLNIREIKISIMRFFTSFRMTLFFSFAKVSCFRIGAEHNGVKISYALVSSTAIISACLKMVSVASFCISGGYPNWRNVLLTMTKKSFAVFSIEPSCKFCFYEYSQVTIFTIFEPFSINYKT